MDNSRYKNFKFENNFNKFIGIVGVTICIPITWFDTEFANNAIRRTR